ncbi:MAG: amino acid adenylation domain-containing protein [Cyclobacteriaceae bacterium]
MHKPTREVAYPESKKPGTTISSPHFWTEILDNSGSEQEIDSALAEKHDSVIVMDLGSTGEALSRLTNSLPAMAETLTWRFFLDIIASAYTCGLSIAHQVLLGTRSKYDGLPLYPFHRQRYWYNDSVSDEVMASEMAVADIAEMGEDEIRKMLTSLVAKLFEEETSFIDPSASLLALGADSMLLMEAGNRIESVFKVSIPLAYFFESEGSVNALTTYIADKNGVRSEGMDENVGAASTGSDTAAPGSQELLYVDTNRPQQHLWVLSQMDSDGWVAYNFSSNLILSGELSYDRVRATITYLTQRHESLRTVLDGEGKHMVISPTVDVSYELYDFTVFAESERDAELERWSLEESRKPFKVDDSLFYRFSLIKMAEEKHVLSLTVHHILFDGWAKTILLKEFANVYTAYSLEQPVRLPEPLQLRELIKLREGQDPDKKANSADYWLGKFSKGIPTLELPTDFVRPAVNTYAGARLHSSLDRRLMKEVESLGRKYNCTRYVTLLSVYTILMHKLSRQADFVIGIPFAGRFLKGSETVVGYCSQLLPVSSSFASGLSFADHLAGVKEELTLGFKHEDYPFSELLDKLKESENIINNPLARATFNTDPVNTLPPIHTLEADLVSTPLSYIAYDLTLNIAEIENGYRAKWNYNTDLFTEETVARFDEYFKNLLRQVVDKPDVSVEELSLLSPEEQVRLWTRHDDGESENTFKSLPHLIKSQVENAPESIALVYNDDELSYAQVHDRALKWKAYLGEQGLGKDDNLAIHVPKSPEAVCLMLGALQAGICFTAIDPGAPASKITHILEDCKPSLLITGDEPGLSYEGIEVATSALREILPSLERLEGATDITTPEESDPVYIVYTSGSTGKPKGIIAQHKGLANYMAYLQQTFRLSGDDSVLQLAPMGFDASIRDIFGPLVAGAKLVMGADSKSPESVREAIDRYKITALLSTVPSLLGALGDHYSNEEATSGSIKLVLTSGEVLSGSVAEMIYKVFHDADLVNLYGPTECTMTTTFDYVSKAIGKRDTISLGKPIPHAGIYILNGANLVPDGLPGEICIGGYGLAKGYQNLPDLTKEKFVALSTGGIEKKLYRTGDLGSIKDDGKLYFLGRLDNQVKVRGFRVELSEVEWALGLHPRVKNCAVILSDDKQGIPGLEAYIVLTGDATTSVELKDFMSGILPDYAIPDSFTTLEALPLTQNGKVDRKTLLGMGQVLSTGNVNRAPESETEKGLYEMWLSLLDKQEISTTDGFFEIGGNSLKAIQMIGRVKKAYGKLLTVADIFAHPTIRQLAQFIGEKSLSDLPAITKIPDAPDYALTYAQNSLWQIDQFEENHVAYNISGMVRLQQAVDRDILAGCFEKLVKRHESLRTVFTIVEGEPRQRVLSFVECGFAMQYHDFSSLDSPQAEVTLEEAATEMPFNLETGPLLKVMLFKMAEEDYRLYCSTHHIISDGWSMNVMLAEIWDRYTLMVNGKDVNLQPLPVQFRDYAAWHNNLLTGDRLKAYQTFWHTYFEGPLPWLSLPYDRPRLATPAFKGKVVYFTIDEVMAGKIRQKGKELNITLFNTLLGLVNLLLHRYSGQDDIITGIPIACRHTKELEKQIGFYINITVLRTRISPELSVAGLLKETHKNMLSIHEQALYPYNLLIQDLEKKGQLQSKGLFNVMVQIQDTHLSLDNAQQTSAIRDQAQRANKTVSKFDLTFNFILKSNSASIETSIEYNTDLFDDSTIDKLRDDFLFLVDKATDDITLGISDQKLMPQNESADYLDDFLKPLDEL